MNNPQDLYTEAGFSPLVTFSVGSNQPDDDDLKWKREYDQHPVPDDNAWEIAHLQRISRFTRKHGKITFDEFQKGATSPRNEDSTHRKSKVGGADLNPRAWSRITTRLYTALGHCFVPVSAATGSLLCIWILAREWNEWLAAPFMLILMIGAAVSPSIFLAMHYRRSSIESRRKKTLGTQVIFLCLTLMMMLGGLITLVGGLFLAVGAVALSCSVVAAIVFFIKNSLGV